MDTSILAGIIFLVVGALVLLSELHTLTIYLLAVAAGLFAAGGLALAGGGLTADFALLAIIGGLLWPSRPAFSGESSSPVLSR